MTEHVLKGRHLRVYGERKLADMWVGVYWAEKDGVVHLWVCLIPCFPIHIEIGVNHD